MKQKPESIVKTIAISFLCLLLCACGGSQEQTASIAPTESVVSITVQGPTETPMPSESARQTETVPLETSEPTAMETPEPTPEPQPLNTPAAKSLYREGYTLEQVVVLSRHNARAPFMGSTSFVRKVTPHAWMQWSCNPGELTVRGGTAELQMGQYFRKWLEAQGLFPANYRPGAEKIRIYANSMQRTIATARFFATGLLPVANVPVETHMQWNRSDPTFSNGLTYMSDAYRAAALAAMREQYAEELAGLADNFALLSDVVDMKASEAWKNGSLTALDPNDLVVVLQQGSDPTSKNSLQTAISISDALVLQYYEAENPTDASFDHALTFAQWQQLGQIKNLWGDILYTTPLLSVNCAHRMLSEIRNELNQDGRVFTFICGHDTNLASVLGALGAERYELSDSIEKTPVGGKVVFSRWHDANGKRYYSVDLVYPTPDQIRGERRIDSANPPGIYSIRLSGLTADENGLYSERDFIGRLQSAFDAYDRLAQDYPNGGNALARIQNRGVLRVGTTGDSLPLSHFDAETGAYWGLDAELAKDLAKALKVDLVFVPTEWSSLMRDLKADKFDVALCGITITDARKQQALMSEGYLDSGKTVLCRAEDADRFTSLEAIDRPEVTAMENPGGSNEMFAQEHLGHANRILHGVKEEIPGLIASGEADVMITETLEAAYYAAQDSRLAAPLLSEPFTQGQFGALMQKDAKDLLAFVNFFLALEKNTGRVDQLARQYLPPSIVDAVNDAA